MRRQDSFNCPARLLIPTQFSADVIGMIAIYITPYVFRSNSANKFVFRVYFFIVTYLFLCLYHNHDLYTFWHVVMIINIRDIWNLFNVTNIISKGGRH